MFTEESFVENETIHLVFSFSNSLKSYNVATMCKKHVSMAQTQPKHYSNKQLNIKLRESP